MMGKFQSPLLGYNNNVRHRGRVFHIQTEDSGVNHPHIITHLFMDGGRILKSVKKSYAEHVGSDNQNETVRAMMKEQHKAMFIALRDGQFDEVALGKKPSGSVVSPLVPPAANPAAPSAGAAAPQPPAAPPPPPPPVVEVAEPPMPREPTAPSVAAVQAPPIAPIALNDIAVVSVVKVSSDAFPAAAPVRSEDTGPSTIDERHRNDFRFGADPPLPPELEALLRDELPPIDPPPPPPLPPPSVAKAAPVDAAPATTREPGPHPSAHELTLDFDALERDTGAGISPLFQQGDLPPPPKNLFTKEPRTGTYKAREADYTPAPRIVPSPAPPAAAAAARPPTMPPPPRAPQKPAVDARYASSRPAAIFGSPTGDKPPSSPSIFSDDLVSDKSLDEVILSYLAEDLDPQRK
jgi:hypothetical protein